MREAISIALFCFHLMLDPICVYSDSCNEWSRPLQSPIKMFTFIITSEYILWISILMQARNEVEMNRIFLNMVLSSFATEFYFQNIGYFLFNSFPTIFFLLSNWKPWCNRRPFNGPKRYPWNLLLGSMKTNSGSLSIRLLETIYCNNGKEAKLKSYCILKVWRYFIFPFL